MSTIERLRALLAEATPGPWRLAGKGSVIVSEEPLHWFVVDTSPADAALIIAAVNALPALLDEREHRRKAMRIETWCPVCERTRCKFDPPDPDAVPQGHESCRACGLDGAS